MRKLINPAINRSVIVYCFNEKAKRNVGWSNYNNVGLLGVSDGLQKKRWRCCSKLEYCSDEFTPREHSWPIIQLPVNMENTNLYVVSLFKIILTKSNNVRTELYLSINIVIYYLVCIYFKPLGGVVRYIRMSMNGSMLCYVMLCYYYFYFY